MLLLLTVGRLGRAERLIGSAPAHGLLSTEGENRDALLHRLIPSQYYYHFIHHQFEWSISIVNFQSIVNLKYPEVTTSFSLSREVVLDGLADPEAAAAAPAASVARGG